MHSQLCVCTSVLSQDCKPGEIRLLRENRTFLNNRCLCVSVHIYFKKNKDFVFMDDGIIITRSESYLCARERAVNFNDSFPNRKAASSPLCQSGNEVSQTKAFCFCLESFLCGFSCAEQRFRQNLELSYLPLIPFCRLPPNSPNTLGAFICFLILSFCFCL